LKKKKKKKKKQNKKKQNKKKALAKSSHLIEFQTSYFITSGWPEF
jgi:hypothetical protein